MSQEYYIATIKGRKLAPEAEFAFSIFGTDWFVHRSIDKNFQPVKEKSWRVCEVTTGCSLPGFFHGSRKKAIRRALAIIINIGKDKVCGRIKDINEVRAKLIKRKE